MNYCYISNGYGGRFFVRHADITIVRMKNSIALPASRPANAVPSMTAIQKARIIRYAKSANFAFALLFLVGTADTASVPFLVFNIVWFAAAAALLAKGGK